VAVTSAEGRQMARLFWPVILPSYILPYHKCDNVSCKTNIYHSKRSPPSSPYTQHNPYWNSPDGLHISSTPPFCFFYSSPSNTCVPSYTQLLFVAFRLYRYPTRVTDSINLYIFPLSGEEIPHSCHLPF
jgi:hypothetical protein